MMKVTPERLRYANALRRGALFAAFVVTLCITWLAAREPTTARAMQDEHAVAPVSQREVGATHGRTYVGEAACLRCHQSLSAQANTPMGEAALDPAGKLPHDYRSMVYSDGAFKVTVGRTEHGLEMTATDGASSKSLPIRWVFGQGNSGQTFVLEDAGKFYESRASYYTALNNLDLTIGHSSRPAASSMAALGRLLPVDEVNKCFSCHTSENIFDGKVTVERSHPGVTCENCHGAGSEHVTSMTSTRSKGVTTVGDILDPGKLPPADMNDFCGSCHRTTRDVLNSGIRDIRNIRFQPYRLENSRCYDPSDPRMTCVACHDPHRNLKKDPVAYDEKCLACHGKAGMKTGHVAAATCPRATSKCVTCHMPKLNLPGAHYAFTDHYIRVVHANEPYPD